MIKEFTQYIANNTVFVLGTDLFMGHRHKDCPPECIVVLETDGITDPYLSDKVDWHVQILTRAKTFMTARDNAWIIHDLIKSNAGLYTPTIVKKYCMMFIEVKNQPTSIGVDQDNRYEFSANYLIRIREDS